MRSTHRGQVGRYATWQQRKVGEAAANELGTIRVQDGINESQSDMRDALAAMKIQGSQWEAVGSRTRQGKTRQIWSWSWTSTQRPAYYRKAYKVALATGNTMCFDLFAIWLTQIYSSLWSAWCLVCLEFRQSPHNPARWSRSRIQHIGMRSTRSWPVFQLPNGVLKVTNWLHFTPLFYSNADEWAIKWE